jgi:hypothetical protein
MTKEQILDEFHLFSLGTGGIGSWLTENTDKKVFERLAAIEGEPLKKVQLNQLLVFGHEAPVSDDFFRYYWLSAHEEHPYDVKKVPGYQKAWITSSEIKSLSHLKWGLYRLFTDGLLWFGNVRTAFRKLRSMNSKELQSSLRDRRIPSELIKERGPALKLQNIPKEDRYLISEPASKLYGKPNKPGELRAVLIQAFRAHREEGGGTVTLAQLLDGTFFKSMYADRQDEFVLATEGFLARSVRSEEELERLYQEMEKGYFYVRNIGLVNTEYFLSMVNDLDVYIATSMSKRKHFVDVADICDKIFSEEGLRKLELRYFDPTASAANNHEDKGLIECLMVRCARALVYCAGEKASYGKDAEAAMALSLGKPVIFYCDDQQKVRFYRDVHPLSRLIEFETGVAVGAMVTDDIDIVCMLLHRIFENKMEYRLEKTDDGYLRLREDLTDSVVRLQTNDTLITETFWNHYGDVPRVAR